MPGKRAEGKSMRGVPLHKDLWEAVAVKASADGRSRTRAIEELIQAYVDGRIALPAEPGD